MNDNLLKIGMAQIAPVWLNKTETLAKVEDYLRKAGEQACELVIFPEALVPGYPYWLSITDGAAFDSDVQKALHAHYLRNAIVPEQGDLDRLCELAAQYKMAIYLGSMERATDRGGHSLYCSLIYIDQGGKIRSVHRKLQPTYEERLSWSPGDGHGLQVHPLKQFHVGGLNCWENWMPLPRAALYGLGEDLHIAVWPGSDYNTKDITRFIARESRSYVISVSGLLSRTEIPDNVPHRDLIIEKAPEVLGNGGSCIAGPDGEWVLEPHIGKEELICHTIDFNRVLEERQNFDPSGHYSRPDVTQLQLNRQRQSIIKPNDA